MLCTSRNPESLRRYTVNALRSGPGNGSSHAAQRRDDGIYGRGDEVLGWSVMVKVADGTGEDTWYWLEYHQGSTYADGVGDSLCHRMSRRRHRPCPHPLPAPMTLAV